MKMCERTDQPVRVVDRDTDATKIEQILALCRSGGAWRSVVFRLGTLIPLNEIGLLAKPSPVSSVARALTTSAQLGLKRKYFQFNNAVVSSFGKLIMQPVRALVVRTAEADSIIGGIFDARSVSPRQNR
jgi:NTE family protein